MTIRNLDALFRPTSIALIGASNQRGSIGAILAANLLTGPLKGHVWPVNPNHRRIRGTKVYRDLERLPQAPDLGVICTPPAAVPGIVADLGRRGARAAVIITAGFAEDREARGSALQREVLEAARAHGLRVLGPNCVGILVPAIGLNASFAHRPAHPGNLAFVAQSGAIITSVLDWADDRGIGFSALVSLGDMADVDFGDLLDYLAADPGTRAILLYIESVGDARKFLSAARAAARIKPLVAVKAGRHPEGARAVASHTGALAGSDAVCQAAFDRAGILRVFTLAELFDAVEILALARPPKGDRLAILTNGGGVGVLATDALIDEGGRLAALSDETLAALDQVLPRTWSHGNPVDLIGDATGAALPGGTRRPPEGPRGGRDPGPPRPDRRGLGTGGRRGSGLRRPGRPTAPHQLGGGRHHGGAAPTLRQAGHPDLRDAGAGGARLHVPGALPSRPAAPDRDPALAPGGPRARHRQRRGPDRRGPGGGAECPHRARGQGRSGGLRDPRGDDPRRHEPRGGGGHRRARWSGP